MDCLKVNFDTRESDALMTGLSKVFFNIFFRYKLNIDTSVAMLVDISAITNNMNHFSFKVIGDSAYK